MEREDMVAPLGSAGILERCSKRGENSSTKRPEADVQTVAVEDGAEKKASDVQTVAVEGGAEKKAADAGSSIDTAAAEGEAKPAGKKRTKLVKVKQGYIDCLLKEPYPKVFDGVPEEFINNVPDPVLRERLRTAQAKTRAHLQKLVDQDLDILNQYRNKGYAMEEVEIYDDEEDMAVEN